MSLVRSLRPSWGGGDGEVTPGGRYRPYLCYISDGINVGDGGGFLSIDQDLLTGGAGVYSSLLQIQASGFWNAT